MFIAELLATVLKRGKWVYVGDKVLGAGMRNIEGTM